MVRYADPGIGRKAAPLGSVEWAQHVRLSLQPLVKQAVRYPREVDSYVRPMMEHRAWTLLNKMDGSTFTSWEEFCETPEPYGCGVPWAKLRALIADALAEAGQNPVKAVALGTVAPAKEAPPPPKHAGPGRGKRTENLEVNGKGQSVPERFSDADDKEAKRLRAINRAPEPIKDAFRSDLIGKGVAAKLGAVEFDTVPEKAAQRAQTVAKVAEVIAAKSPKTPAEKRKVAREVNAIVREELGEKKDPVVELVRVVERAVAKFTHEQRVMFRAQLAHLLSKEAA